MPEEMRFFFRIALYTALITTIYWFVSYEVAGTVMLSFLFAACVFFVTAATFLKNSAPEAPQTGSFVRRAVGFDPPDEDPGAPLELEEGLFPTASLWPLTAAMAATLVGLGAIYGPWLWIPGASLGLATGTAWLTQLRP